jgi:hypothetical protein
MRLDHISYAASHDQLVDVVQRLGSRIGSAFTDGGIHPRFGTRNFTLALKNGHYLEVVCPLDHPAADASPFGKVVSQRANEGGGWLTWVLSTDDISPLEKKLGREAVEGHRMRPDGTDLRWKQLGVLNTLEDSQLPFFIQWQTSNHPSKDGVATASISKIEIAGSSGVIEEWTDTNLNSALLDIDIIWIDPINNDGSTGIVAVYLETSAGQIKLD